ncbi:MAG: hypothetical protein ACO3JL_08595 [Myxococcota bacterium]
MRPFLLASLLSLVCPSAFAFEGVLHVDVESEGTTSRARALLSAAGDTRLDVEWVIAGRRWFLGVFCLGAMPSACAVASHDLQAFERRVLPKSTPRADRFLVNDRGTGRLLGREVRHFLVEDRTSGDLYALARAPSIDARGGLGQLLVALRPGGGDLGAALAAAGGGGTPLLFEWRRKHGGVVRAKVVELHEQPLRPRDLELPADYRQAPLPFLR